MVVLMCSLEQTGDSVFHVLSVASIFWIQSSQSEITPQGRHAVHHLQIPIGLDEFCRFFEKLFRGNRGRAHGLNSSTFRTIQLRYKIRQETNMFEPAVFLFGQLGWIDPLVNPRCFVRNMDGVGSQSNDRQDV